MGCSEENLHFGLREAIRLAKERTGNILEAAVANLGIGTIALVVIAKGLKPIMRKLRYPACSEIPYGT